MKRPTKAAVKIVAAGFLAAFAVPIALALYFALKQAFR